MRRAGLLLCVVPLLLIGMTAVPAAAATPTTLYVDDLNNRGCEVNGPGTQAQPFCDIQQAADVVQPGQTVIVGPNQTNSVYEGDVHVTHSGTPDQPITFEAGTPWEGGRPAITVAPIFLSPADQNANGFVLDNVHDVTITGFGTEDDTTAGITVSNSSDITIDHVDVNNNIGLLPVDGIDVTGTSHDITISRSDLSAGANAVAIGPAAARVAVARNMIGGGLDEQILVDGATGTTITSNTSFDGACFGAIAVEDSATATTIENNVLENACDMVPAPIVTVAADSVRTTALDYNVVFGTSTQAVPYAWAGVTYRTAAALAAATGQGTHDMNTNPRLSAGDVPQENSPAVDSGDANAPGFLAADFNRFTAEDDPLVANTGTGSGDVDRGAVERTDPMTVHGSLSANQAPTGGTVTVTVTSTPGWTPIAGLTVDFGDGTQVPATGGTVPHVYTTTGFHDVTVTATDTLGYVSAPVEAPGGVVVVPPAPLAPRITAQPGNGFNVTADASASTDSWNIVSFICDFGDGTATVPAFQESCPHTYAHGGAYRITLALTDAGGNSASTSTLIAVPTNGFQPSGVPAVINGGHGCAACRGTNAAAPAHTASTSVATIGHAAGPSAPVSPVVGARWHGCLPQAACSATAV